MRCCICSLRSPLNEAVYLRSNRRESVRCRCNAGSKTSNVTIFNFRFCRAYGSIGPVKKKNNFQGLLSMGVVVRFPVRRHARASSRAASRASKSEVRPTPRALSVDRTRGHHFDGMLSRLNHLITAQFPASTSAAIASREGHSSITDRNDVRGESESVMNKEMGQYVPNCKAVLSHDLELSVGHSVQMREQDEKIAESAWREAFVARLRQIQGNRTQEQMSKILGISRDSWNKCVNRGDQPSIRILPILAALGEMTLAELIDGPEAAGVKKTLKTKTKAAAPKRRAS